MKLRALLMVCLAAFLVADVQATTVTVDFSNPTDADDFIVIRDDTPSNVTLGIAINTGKGVGAVPGGGLEAINVGTENQMNDLAVLYAPGGVASDGVIAFGVGETITMSVKFKVLDNTKAATPRLGIASFADVTSATTNWTVLDINAGKDVIGNDGHADGIAVNLATGNSKTFNIVNSINGTGRTLIPDPEGEYTLVDDSWYQFVLVIVKSATADEFDVTITLNGLSADGTAFVSEIGYHSETVTNAPLYADGDVIAGLTIVHDAEPDSCTNEYDDLVITAPTWGIVNANNPVPSDGAENVVLSTTTLTWTNPSYVPSSYSLEMREGVEANEPNWLAPTGTETSSPTVGAGTTTTAIPAGITLDYEKDYYWRVISNDGGTVHTGPSWKFSTVLEIPTIIVEPVYTTIQPGGTSVDLTIEAVVTDVYKWYEVGDPVTAIQESGTLGTPLASDTLTVSIAGNYYCVVSNNITTDIDTSDTVGVMTAGLVAHWAFENNLTDSESGYTGTYVDPSGATTPAAVYSYSVYPAGDPNNFVGQSLLLDGDNNGGLHVQIDNSADDFNFYQGGHTISAWVRPTQGGYGCVVGKQNLEKNQGYVLNHNGNTAIHKVLGSGSGDTASASGTGVRDGDWHMMTGTFDATTLEVKVYVDGVMVASSTKTQIPGTHDQPLLFGVGTGELKENGDPVSAYTGYIDEVRIWNYARTAAEVAWDYNDYIASGALPAGTPAPCISTAGLEYDVAGAYDAEGNPIGDCRITLADFVEAIALNWMNCREAITGSDCVGDPR